MRVCGVQIKSKEAILVLVEELSGATKVIPSPTKRLILEDHQSTASLKDFIRAAEAFIHENKVDFISIKLRQGKGERSASGVTFKIETLLQLTTPNVVYAPANSMKKLSKTNSGAVPGNLAKYQEDAFLAAAWQLKKSGLI